MTYDGRAAFGLSMKTLLLVGLLLATAACGGYRYPGTVNETGTVHGQVTALNCSGLVQPASRPCPVSPIECPPRAAGATCGLPPISGMALVFTQGKTSFVAKTDAAGAYSIDLPVGTWDVTTATFARITSGPQTLDVKAGTSIVANFTVDTGLRAAT